MASAVSAFDRTCESAACISDSTVQTVYVLLFCLSDRICSVILFRLPADPEEGERE